MFCCVCVSLCRSRVPYLCLSQMNTGTNREGDRGAWNETCNRCCVASPDGRTSKPRSKPRKVPSNKCVSDQPIHRGSCALHAWRHFWQRNSAGFLWFVVGAVGERCRFPQLCWCGNCCLGAWIDFERNDRCTPVCSDTVWLCTIPTWGGGGVNPVKLIKLHFKWFCPLRAEIPTELIFMKRIFWMKHGILCHLELKISKRLSDDDMIWWWETDTERSSRLNSLWVDNIQVQMFWEKNNLVNLTKLRFYFICLFNLWY